MELTNYTATGTLSFWPPINPESWNSCARSFRSGRVLALTDGDGKTPNATDNGTAVFFPEFDHNGLRAVTVRDNGPTTTIVARLAAFIDDWTDATAAKPRRRFDHSDIRSFSGRITGTGPGGEANMWAVDDNRIVDLRLDEPDWLLLLLEVSGKNLIEWLTYQDETDPYGVYDLGESIASLTHEMSDLCPGLGGALTHDATLDATYEGITDEEYEATSDDIAGDAAAKGAWAIAIVAKTLGLADAWTAHLAARAKERRVTGDLTEYAVQAKTVTAPHRNEWDDDEDDNE